MRKETGVRLVYALGAILMSLIMFSWDTALNAQSVTRMTGGVKAITAAATQINTESGCSVLVGNLGTTKVWIGGSTVSSSTGWPVCSDSSACYSTAVEIPGSVNAVFAITTDGGSVHWMQGKSCK